MTGPPNLENSTQKNLRKDFILDEFYQVFSILAYEKQLSIPVHISPISEVEHPLVQPPHS